MGKKLINKIKILLFSLRDALSFTFVGVPIKPGEIYASCEIIKSASIPKAKKISNIRVQNILFLLLANFFLSVIISLANYNSIDHSFFIKYELKSLFYLVFIYCIAKYSYKNNISFLKSLFKGIVIIQVLFAILLYGFNKQVVGFSLVPPSQFINLGSHSIPRFVGTASEPAYIIPILAIPFFYFLLIKGDKVWFFISLILLMITFSPFAIMIIIFGLLLSILLKNRKNALNVLIILSSFLVLLLSIYLVSQLTPLGKQLNSMIDKAVGFISFGSKGKADWSATDRLQHINYAIELIKEASPLQLLFGRGTGSYYYNSLNNTKLLITDVEEAYNLYLSTIVDRGIIGFIILILLIYNIFKSCKSKNNPTILAIKFGILVQFIHFFLVGNLWLYFLWIEVGFLISYDNYLRRKTDENIINNK